MAYLGHKPAVGENNSFRILDDISSFVLTFDGSSASVVGLSDETITITENNHRFITGQRVTYSNGGGGNITGLTNGQAYFVINHSKTQIKLASSASNALAGTAVNLTGLGTGSSHTLTLAFDGVNTKFDPTFGDGMHDTLIKRAAQLVISINGVIQQPHDTATPSTGFGVDSLGHIIFSTAPASTDIFWGHILATNTVTFDSSDNDVDTFTGNGSTTSFTLSKTPPDNRNILVTIDGVVQYPSDAANTRSYNVSENVMTFVAAPGNGTVIQVRHIGYAGIGAGGGGGVTGFYGRTGNVSLVSTDNITVNDAAITGNATVTGTTQSTNKDTGALIVEGGVGIEKNLNVGGNASITGDLTVQGTTTTLDTVLTEVDKLEVAANNTTVGAAITQSGTGDILNLYDGSTEVFSVADGGKVDILSTNNLLTLKKATNGNYCGIELDRDNSGTEGGTIGLAGGTGHFITSAVIHDLTIRSANGNILFGSGQTEVLRTNPSGAKVTGILTATTFVGDGDFVDIDVDGQTELDDLNVAGVSTFTGSIDANSNLDVAGIATVTTRLNINTVSNARLAVAGTNYAWRGQFMIKDTTTGASAMPYMTFWDGSEANDGSNTGLLGRAGHVNGGGINERFDFWTYRSTTPLSLGTNGYERLRILPAGQTLITTNTNGNTISARTVLSNYTPTLQIEGNSKSSTSASLTANVNNAVGPSLWFAKTRGTSLGSNTAVQDDDELGTIVFNGADGTDIQTMGAYIRGAVDGSVSSNDVPSRLQFHTATGGTMYERLRIQSDGKIKFGATGAVVGSATIEMNYANPVLLIRDTAENSADGDAKIAFGNTNHYPTAYISHIWDGTNGALTFHTRLSGNESEKLRITATGNATLGAINSSTSSTFHIRSLPDANTRLELATKSNYSGSYPDADIVFTQQVTGTELAKIQCDTVTGAANRAHLVFHTNYGGIYRRLVISDQGQVRAGDECNSDRTSYRHQFSSTAGSGDVLSLQNPSNSDGQGIGLGFFARNTNNAAIEIAKIKAVADETQANSTQKGSLRFLTNIGASMGERMRITNAGQLFLQANTASGYTAEFRQTHADNPAWIDINSPTDNDLRPAYIQLSRASSKKWGIGMVYAPTSAGSFHIGTGSHSQGNAKFTITTAGRIGIGTAAPAGRANACLDIAIDNNTTGHGVLTDQRGASQLTLRNHSTTLYSYTQLMFTNGRDGFNSATFLRHTKGGYLQNENYIGDLILMQRVAGNGSANPDFREKTTWPGGTIKAKQIWWGNGTGQQQAENHMGWHRFVEQNPQGNSEYQYFTLDLGSASYSRAGLARYTILWNTGHASGTGHQTGEFRWFNHHSNTTCNVLEHIILRRGYNNGSYYGWNDAPYMKLFTNTATGNDAGIHLRCQGRRSSGYDMGLYVTVFMDLYVPKSSNGNVTPTLRARGTSQPANFGSEFQNDSRQASYVSYQDNAPDMTANP